MAPQEVAFIKAYSVVLRHDFVEFNSALQLMRSEVGVACPMRAAQLARQLRKLQDGFEADMAAVAVKRRLLCKQQPPVPSVRELEQVLQISFFKLVQAKGERVESKGWYSGHPFSWEETWKKTDPDTPPDQPTSAILNAFLKLLGDIVTGTQPGPWFSTKPPQVDDQYDDEDEDDSFEDFDQDTDY